MPFQSTRPRGARLACTEYRYFYSVSIHAPAGGATPIVQDSITRSCFNPRARGGRDLMIIHPLISFRFQSTRPRGARLFRRQNDKLLLVSIHAPAGGATPTGRHPLQYWGFNPRARGGRDIYVVMITNLQRFQSTRPRGARRSSQDRAPDNGVSIHAPAGGATDHWADCVRYYGFNPRARGGRDR